LVPVLTPQNFKLANTHALAREFGSTFPWVEQVFWGMAVEPKSKNPKQFPKPKAKNPTDEGLNVNCGFCLVFCSIKLIAPGGESCVVSFLAKGILFNRARS